MPYLCAPYMVQYSNVHAFRYDTYTVNFKTHCCANKYFVQSCVQLKYVYNSARFFSVFYQIVFLSVHTFLRMAFALLEKFEERFLRYKNASPSGTPPFPPVWLSHALNNYTDTKAKFRHLKKLACKGTSRQMFIRVCRLEIQSVMLVFSTQLCELLPLWVNSPPLSVWISILYTHIQCVRGGYGVLGLRQINTCRKVPLQVNFVRWRHIALLSISLIFLRAIPAAKRIKSL
jgi:hypothetical protein